MRHTSCCFVCNLLESLFPVTNCHQNICTLPQQTKISLSILLLIVCLYLTMEFQMQYLKFFNVCSILACGMISSVYAANCTTTDMATATELSTEITTLTCSGNTTCILPNGIYKITSSITSMLPPIKIPSGATLCIQNLATPAPINILAQSFWVDGGIFQIGKPEDPILSTNKVTITMTGTHSAAPAPQPICSTDKTRCSAIATISMSAANARDITVSKGGQLLMYGVKGLTSLPGTASNYIHSIDYHSSIADGTAINQSNQGQTTSGDIDQIPYFNKIVGANSWTYLTYPAGPAYFNEDLDVQSPITLSNYPAKLGTVTLTEADLPYLVALAKDTTHEEAPKWESGDWISIATTTFIPHETEIVKICNIYDIDNPDTQIKSDIFANYHDVVGGEKTSMVVLAGAPSFTTECSSITENTPLKHYHFGSLPPSPGYFNQDTPNYKQKYNAKKGQAYSFYDDGSRNFGIDERAEVALLSRNIKLTSTAGTTSTSPIPQISDQYFGGHIVIMNHADTPNEKVELVGVEIEKFGQPIVGRYPIHFHRLNAQSDSEDKQSLLVQDSVVHHSFNKCFVTHDTMGVSFYNNVCVRTIGQGFYLEDGYNVAGNQYIRNHVAGTMVAALNYNPSLKKVSNAGGVIGINTYWDGDYLAQQDGFNYDPSKIPDTSDSGANTGNHIDSFEPSGFWITSFGNRYNGKNYPNLFVNNSVAGCQLRGAAYWTIRQNVQKMSDVPSTQKSDLYPVFVGNRGHACYDGFIAGDNSMVQATAPGVIIGPQALPVPIGNDVNSNANIPYVIFDDLTFTQIEHKAFWYRNVFIGINNSRFSALKQGMTLLGGGGPEGNLLGFWGLVHNSIFAGVTNNNVGRYSDCEEYYKKYGVADASILTNNEALPLELSNEMAKCVPIDMTAVSETTDISITNNNAVFGDIVAYFNFQGYTFYDGPARMEDNRFINFRADVTDPVVFNNARNQYSTTENRHLVTKIDAHRMMNYQKASQLSEYYHPGGNKHYGATGDAAFSWLKANKQSVPPTQYAKGNLWDNVNFKHQIFTEISNLNNGLQDGDKQTVEIDKDATLSGYKLCATANSTVCSNNTANHYPISLNNLNFFATKYTTDEPHSQGRNNVVSSALMSPHKYATVNVVVAEQPKDGITNLHISRDMKVYTDEKSSTTYTGRGGLPFVYESIVMNNMGYTYSTDNFNGNGQFLFSFSDAPVDTTFINRVGVCIGKSATDIEIYKAPRQWNSGAKYLTASPYFGDKAKYGLTNTFGSCPDGISKKDAYSKCQNTAIGLKDDGSQWGKINPYSTSTDLNTAFSTILESNYNNYSTINIEPGGVTEGYYYDASSGILYFNMIQYAENTTPPDPVTPPFATCDSASFTNSTTPNKGTKKTITNYMKFSNTDSLNSIIDIGCYAESGTPKTSELLTCPDGGCPVYTVGFNSSHNTPTCTPSSWTTITEGTTPGLSEGVFTYTSPYTLYDNSTGTALSPSQASITAKGKGTLSTKRTYHYISTTGGSLTTSGASTLLPMPPLPSNENGNTYAMTDKPAVSIFVFDGPPIPIQGNPPKVKTKWTLATGDVNATISGAKFAGPPSAYTPKLSYDVTPSHSSGEFYLLGSYPQTVKLSIKTSGPSAKTHTCNTLKLLADGTVNATGCTQTFMDHLTINPPAGKGAPTTLTAH